MLKKILPVFLLLSIMVLSSGKKDEKVIPSRSPDKAVLVIMRFVHYPQAKEALVYVDNKALYETDEECYYIVELEPGEHDLLGHVPAGPKHLVKFTVEANKIYYCHLEMAPFVVIINTAVPDDFDQFLNKMRYISKDDKKRTKKAGKPDKSYEKALEEYEKDLLDNPEKYQEFLNFTGF